MISLLENSHFYRVSWLFKDYNKAWYKLIDFLLYDFQLKANRDHSLYKMVKIRVFNIPNVIYKQQLIFKCLLYVLVEVVHEFSPLRCSEGVLPHYCCRHLSFLSDMCSFLCRKTVDKARQQGGGQPEYLWGVAGNQALPKSPAWLSQLFMQQPGIWQGKRVTKEPWVKWAWDSIAGVGGYR